MSMNEALESSVHFKVFAYSCWITGGALIVFAIVRMIKTMRNIFK